MHVYTHSGWNRSIAVNVHSCLRLGARRNSRPTVTWKTAPGGAIFSLRYIATSCRGNPRKKAQHDYLRILQLQRVSSPAFVSLPTEVGVVTRVNKRNPLARSPRARYAFPTSEIDPRVRCQFSNIFRSWRGHSTGNQCLFGRGWWNLAGCTRNLLRGYYVDRYCSENIGMFERSIFFRQGQVKFDRAKNDARFSKYFAKFFSDKWHERIRCIKAD